MLAIRSLLLIYCLDASIRIVGGTNEREGRVEIMYQGIWGTICDNGWDDIDATVVCREMGYSHGNAIRQAQFGLGTGPVWLHQVGCLGNESKLSHCIHTGAGNVGNCSHALDAGVRCSEIFGKDLIYLETVSIYFSEYHLFSFMFISLTCKLIYSGLCEM